MIDAPAQRPPTTPGGSARLQLWLMMTLTFVTGIVDAVGYLALDKVFTGNMTGNIVILAMGLAGGNDLPVLGPLLALASFAAGALLAGYVLRRRDGRWGIHITWLLGAGAVLLGTIAAVAATGGPTPPPPMAITIACLIALQMGSQACVARKLAVRDMTTVVVTSTLTALAGESFLHGGFERIWNRRAGAILAIFTGAGAGALLLRMNFSIALTAAAVLTLAAVFIGHKSWNKDRPPHS